MNEESAAMPSSIRELGGEDTFADAHAASASNPQRSACRRPWKTTCQSRWPVHTNSNRQSPGDSRSEEPMTASSLVCPRPTDVLSSPIAASNPPRDTRKPLANLLGFCGVFCKRLDFRFRRLTGRAISVLPMGAEHHPSPSDLFIAPGRHTIEPRAESQVEMA